MLANVGKCWQMVANGRRQKVVLSARAGTTEVSTSTSGNWPQKCCRGPVATSSVAHVSTVISCVRLSWSSPHTDFPGISAEHSWAKPAQEDQTTTHCILQVAPFPSQGPCHCRWQLPAPLPLWGFVPQRGLPLDKGLAAIAKRSGSRAPAAHMAHMMWIGLVGHHPHGQ